MFQNTVARNLHKCLRFHINISVPQPLMKTCKKRQDPRVHMGVEEIVGGSVSALSAGLYVTTYYCM
jgi:hypothetical protein